MGKGAKNAFLIGILSLGFGLPSLARANVITPVDLNDFFADPTVTVAPDGSSATFLEDPLFFTVILSNDPGLGDPDVIIPAANRQLLFDFDFIEPAGNDDEFIANLIDASTGLFIPGFTFSRSSTEAGSHTVDLSSFIGETLGLQFELAANLGDVDFTSTLVVSNVRLVTTVATVPEPPTVFLALLGIALGWLGRSAHRGRSASAPLTSGKIVAWHE